MWSLVAVLSVAVVILGALGVVSCLVSQQRAVPGVMGGEPPHSTLPMLALHSGMERLRLEASHGAGGGGGVGGGGGGGPRAPRGAVELPPNIPLPDGEEFPYGASTRMHIRDSEQESEIYQKCIRPPPNRTVFDGESPPPYRQQYRQPYRGASSCSSPALRYHHHHHHHRRGPTCEGPNTTTTNTTSLVLPAVIVPSRLGKHSTNPPASQPHQHPPQVLPATQATPAPGLVRLLSPDDGACRTARQCGKESVELVNVPSTPCATTPCATAASVVRVSGPSGGGDIPGQPAGSQPSSPQPAGQQCHTRGRASDLVQCRPERPPPV